VRSGYLWRDQFKSGYVTLSGNVRFCSAYNRLYLVRSGDFRLDEVKNGLYGIDQFLSGYDTLDQVRTG